MKKCRATMTDLAGHIVVRGRLMHTRILNDTYLKVSQIAINFLLLRKTLLKIITIYLWLNKQTKQ